MFNIYPNFHYSLVGGGGAGVSLEGPGFFLRKVLNDSLHRSKLACSFCSIERNDLELSSLVLFQIRRTSGQSSTSMPWLNLPSELFLYLLSIYHVVNFLPHSTSPFPQIPLSHPLSPMTLRFRIENFVQKISVRTVGQILVDIIGHILHRYKYKNNRLLRQTSVSVKGRPLFVRYLDKLVSVT